MNKEKTIAGFKLVVSESVPTGVVFVGRDFVEYFHREHGNFSLDTTQIVQIKNVGNDEHRVAKKSAFIEDICAFCKHPLHHKDYHFLTHDQIRVCVHPSVGHNPEPVFYKNDKWWFWDETWNGPYGPFDYYSQAVAELDKYLQET